MKLTISFLEAKVEFDNHFVINYINIFINTLISISFLNHDVVTFLNRLIKKMIK